MTFSETIESAYRVVITRYGEGDSEETIPLGSWRKGGGLDGSKGHVYRFNPRTAGVWIKGQGPRQRMEALQVQFPNLRIMQVGCGEGTFSIPDSDLDRILPVLKAKRRPVMTEARLAAIEKASAKAAPYRFKAKDGGQMPSSELG